MSRGIRFRAWDVANKEMVYNVHLNDGKPVKPGYQWFDQQNTVHDSEPMQYTGLLDKNGVEIYEGDIVKGHYYRERKPHRIVGEVVYITASFIVRGINKHYGLVADLDATYEVIGNVFENPDLLETAGDSK